MAGYASTRQSYLLGTEPGAISTTAPVFTSIWTSRTRTQQGGTQVDWWNPLTKDLRFLFSASDTVDSVAGDSFINNGSVVVADQSGIARRVLSTNTWSLADSPARRVNGAATVFMLCNPMGGEVGFEKDSSVYGGEYNLRTGNGAIWVNRGQAGNWTRMRGGAGLPTTGLYFAAVSFLDGNISSQYNWPFYFNGRALGGGTFENGEGSGAVNTTTAAIVFDKQSWQEGSITLAGVFSRVLIDAEHRELARNPWQLFRASPKRVYIGV